MRQTPLRACSERCKVFLPVFTIVQNRRDCRRGWPRPLLSMLSRPSMPLYSKRLFSQSAVQGLCAQQAPEVCTLLPRNRNTIKNILLHYCSVVKELHDQAQKMALQSNKEARTALETSTHIACEIKHNLLGYVQSHSCQQLHSGRILAQRKS
jgi:hypothetical protein